MTGLRRRNWWPRRHGVSLLPRIAAVPGYERKWESGGRPELLEWPTRRGRLPDASAIWSRALVRVSRGGAQLIPNFAVGIPFGILEAGDLQFRKLQGAVAIRAYVFDARPAQKQHAAPRSGLDRHAHAPQANPAAVALIPDAEVQQTAER